MRNRLKAAVLTAVGIVALLGSGLNANAQVTVGVDSGANWQGFMNVFELPSNGGGFVFGSTWATVDLTANFSGSTLTLRPNTIGDPNPFWYTPSGGPGATGNKIMDASFYIEQTGPFAGKTITFTGNVLANTLVSPYTSVAFIKDFASDFSSVVTTTAPLVNGVFSINLTTINDPARHVQYGFETVGPNVWITDVAPKGFVQIAPVPEPSTTAFIIGGVAFLGLMVRRQRSNA